ncbi:hypothetical protein, partial [Thiolapillus sp.]|uniref:hypothetical protein n=1 Tax=Thiolapillus sp. TaxID=2017437 RepID=UPI003AF99C3E
MMGAHSIRGRAFVCVCQLLGISPLGAPSTVISKLASVADGFRRIPQACLRPRDRFWDIPVPKIDSAFDNLLVPQPSWSPSTTQQLRKLVAAPYLAPNDWTPRSEAYFVFPLAQGTPGKQCGLAATGVYQPSLRSPWLAATVSAISAGPYPVAPGYSSWSGVNVPHPASAPVSVDASSTR